MAREVINTGSAANDPTAESIRAAFTKVNNMTLALYHTAGHNVLDYGAVGNSHITTGGGTDDAAAIQAAVDAAAASGGMARVVFPGKRTYRLASTITVPQGVHLVGLGGLDGQGAGAPAFFWSGTNNGTVFDIPSSAANIFGTRFENLSMYAGISANIAGTFLKFRGVSGGTAALDSGTVVKDCWFMGGTADAIRIESFGATNFYLFGGRFDGPLGYGIYVDLNGAGHDFHGHIYAATYQSAAFIQQGKGFLFLDGESVTDNGKSLVTITGLHTEVNVNMVESFAAGTNPYDKRGLIRLGVDPDLGGGQAQLLVNGWQNNFAAGLSSYSAIQITATSGTDAEIARCAHVTINEAVGLHEFNSADSGATGEVRMFGGKVPAAARYPFVGFRHGHINWGLGKDSSYEYYRHFIYATEYRIRGLSIHPEAGTNAPLVRSGTGSPSIADPNGSLYLRTDGSSTNDNVYVRRNGAWVGIA